MQWDSRGPRLLWVSPGSACCPCPLLPSPQVFGPSAQSPLPKSHQLWLGTSSPSQTQPPPAPRHKPESNPHVLAAPAYLFTTPPRILPSKAHLAPARCAFFLPRSWLLGRGQGAAGRPRQGAACHCRCGPSLPESCLEDPPLIPCFCQEHQPPPASQTRGGSRRLRREASPGSTLVISLIRIKREEAEGAPRL